MKYVLDANVALKWVLPEFDSSKSPTPSPARSERATSLSAMPMCIFSIFS